jgi:hypothetical protein
MTLRPTPVVGTSVIPDPDPGFISPVRLSINCIISSGFSRDKADSSLGIPAGSAWEQGQDLPFPGNSDVQGSRTICPIDSELRVRALRASRGDLIGRKMAGRRWSYCRQLIL